MDLTRGKSGRTVYDLREIIGESTSFHLEQMTIIENGEGPTVLVCGGIHGDEYEPQIMLRKLARDVEPGAVSGRLIIIPSVNFPGSQKGMRTSSVDDANLNRTFPGRSDGTASERIAHFMATELFPQCDLLIDLHTGGAEYRVVPYVFGFTNADCAIRENRLEDLMESWGYRFIQYQDSIPSTAVGNALLQNLASLETEGGNGADIDINEVDIVSGGLARCLAQVGVLQSKTGPSAPKLSMAKPIRVRVTKENQYVAPRDGVVQHTVKLGQLVQKGELLAILHPVSDEHGETLEIHSPVEGYVMRLNANAFLKAGTLIGNTGSVIG